MSVAAWSSSRWRAFADAVAVALGINLWVSLVVLPGLFVGALGAGATAAAAVAPLVVLAIGVWRRSEVVLLLGFPSALLFPVATAPAIATEHVFGPVRFAVVAIGLVLYLFGASVLSSFYEPSPPVSVRPLASAATPVSERWRRRFRIYAGLAVLSVVFPAVLIYSVNFDELGRRYLVENYPGRAASFTTFLNLVAIGAWLLLYAAFFLGTLRPHRTGDRDLQLELARLRKATTRKSPRPVFYVGVVAAIGLMILLLLSRG